MLAVSLVAASQGRFGIVLVSLCWWLTQVATMRRDSYRRGVISRRHTLVRGYLALPVVFTLGQLIQPRLSATAVVFALVLLVFYSMSVRLALTLRGVRRRLGHQVDTRVILVGSPVQLERALARYERDESVRLVAVCVDPNRSEYAGARLKGEIVFASLAEIPDVVQRFSIDQVRVLPGGLMDSDLEALAWDLEATAADLVLEVALTGVARERMSATVLGGAGMVIRSFRADQLVQRVRGVVDRVAAVALLVIVTPVMLATALAVRIGSEGPVLFRQTRVGQHGRTFTMLKFRTMSVDAEERLADLVAVNDHADGVLFKMRRDPRVTPVGRFLRAVSLDELPQLVNVVLGQMSIVGPRPALPAEVDRYERRARRRLAVKPGLTGLWQVSGRSLLSWEESIRLDLDYVDNWTATRDARILLKTARVVVNRDGAY
ncbi:MAG: exopolysaccharide biosynthesis polyprenyl glycosylphosphotransferase [Nocardioides sp.]